MASNAGRYRIFRSTFHSVTTKPRDACATWNRCAISPIGQAGAASDAPTWQALVSGAHGISNLSAVFGNDLPARVRDWSIAHYTDDLVTGVATEFTHPSWNFHSIYPALSGSGNTYPLKVDPMTAAGVSGNLIGGAAAYYRFSIPAGRQRTSR
jgi:hypothetical protein